MPFRKDKEETERADLEELLEIGAISQALLQPPSRKEPANSKSKDQDPTVEPGGVNTITVDNDEQQQQYKSVYFNEVIEEDWNQEGSIDSEPGLQIAPQSNTTTKSSQSGSADEVPIPKMDPRKAIRKATTVLSLTASVVIKGKTVKAKLNRPNATVAHTKHGTVY
eukprot:1512468-Rhodomonas_salina.2